MKLAVAGTGYVGLSIATLLAQHHEVMAVDIIEDNHLIIDSNANELINKVKELHYDVIPLFLGKKECKNFKKIREED